MIAMKLHCTALAAAALLVIGQTLPGHAEDAPAASTAPAATRTEAPPPSFPRPSIVPKTAPTLPAADADTAPPRHRRYAHRHRRYGYYRTAYWEPFPIYWPHFYHHRIHWNRIPWIVRF